MYQALNALGAVPWQINREVLDVVKELYEDETGYKHLKIPAKQSLDIPLPMPPAHTYRIERTKNGGLIARVRAVCYPSLRHMYVTHSALNSSCKLAARSSAKILCTMSSAGLWIATWGARLPTLTCHMLCRRALLAKASRFTLTDLTVAVQSCNPSLDSSFSLRWC